VEEIRLASTGRGYDPSSGEAGLRGNIYIVCNDAVGIKLFGVVAIGSVDEKPMPIKCTIVVFRKYGTSHPPDAHIKIYVFVIDIFERGGESFVSLLCLGL
jgi:hypothetical protein